MVDKIDGKEKKSGLKIRSKFVEANMVDSEDDEPIGYSNGHVEDRGLDGKSVSRVLEKDPVMGDDGSDVTISIKVENKLNGKGKRPKISGSLGFGVGSNCLLDHHPEDSLSSFSRKSQSGLIMNSRASSSPKEKSGSKVLEDGLNTMHLAGSNPLDSASDL
ncbi:hypothetical protein C1H46_016508 [Malus baccata]|uniref:Uncharacterized protein n=1 Tax=Malus baccata TaxID=106549 RepID=A0A540MGZ9_MALBA|nr:hypothetical protein C1H46_016508 [Malus baccata]